MNPTLRYVIRIFFVMAVAAASALQAGGDWKDIVASAIVAGGSYAGVGAATPLEASVGVGKKT